MDVKNAIVQDGLALSAGDDTGASAIDLVTNILRPEFTFTTDEEITSARLVQVSHLASGVQGKTPLAAYDLTITETEADDGFTYDAALTLATDQLSHGLWAIETTDVAGNIGVSDTSGLGVNSDYSTNLNIVSKTNGVFVVDTVAAPDANITIESVESEGGYINQYEQTATLKINILPGRDASDNANANLQVADITV